MDDANKAIKTQKRIKNKSKKKTILLILFFAVFVGVAVVASIFYFSATNNDLTDRRMSARLAESSRLANNGKVDDAVSSYEELIKDIKDPKMKSNMLIEKALVYENNNLLDKALMTAKEAEAIFDSLMVVDFIARIYDKLGDTNNSILYYQKAIDSLDENSPGSKRNV